MANFTKTLIGIPLPEGVDHEAFQLTRPLCRRQRSSVWSLLPFTKAGKQRRTELDRALSDFRETMDAMQRTTEAAKRSCHRMALIQGILQSFNQPKEMN